MKLSTHCAIVVVATVGLAVAQSASADRPPAPVRTTLDVLNQTIPEVRFDHTPLEAVLKIVSELTGTKIVPRWTTLNHDGIHQDTPITLDISNRRLSEVLWLILSEAGGPDVVLAYRASGNLVILSTAADLERELITRVYDVADLLYRVPQTPRPVHESSQTLGQSQGSIFRSVGQRSASQERNLTSDGSDSQMTELATLIEETIDPDSWQSNNGLGRIRAFGSRLIITNTITVHQKIGGYVREQPAVALR